MDLPQESISNPPAQFDSVITMPSNDFQKIIRDMINIGEDIEITSIGNQLKLVCNGEFAHQETVLGETNNGLKFSTTQSPELPIQGVFSLKYLFKCPCNCIRIAFSDGGGSFFLCSS